MMLSRCLESIIVHTVSCAWEGTGLERSWMALTKWSKAGTKPLRTCLLTWLCVGVWAGAQRGACGMDDAMTGVSWHRR